jgi:hypothetical protein
MLNKQAYLQKIYDAAFKEELEKIALSPEAKMLAKKMLRYKKLSAKKVFQGKERDIGLGAFKGVK